MRNLWIGLAGLAAAAGAFGISQMTGGFTAAASFVLAAMIVPVSLGVALAPVVSRRLDRPSRSRRVRRWLATRGSGTNYMAEIMRCRECGRARALRAHVFVCERCDYATVTS